MENVENVEKVEKSDNNTIIDEDFSSTYAVNNNNQKNKRRKVVDEGEGFDHHSSSSSSSSIINVKKTKGVKQLDSEKPKDEEEEARKQREKDIQKRRDEENENIVSMVAKGKVASGFLKKMSKNFKKNNEDEDDDDEDENEDEEFWIPTPFEKILLENTQINAKLYDIDLNEETCKECWACKVSLTSTANEGYEFITEIINLIQSSKSDISFDSLIDEISNMFEETKKTNKQLKDTDEWPKHMIRAHLEDHIMEPSMESIKQIKRYRELSKYASNLIFEKNTGVQYGKAGVARINKEARDTVFKADASIMSLLYKKAPTDSWFFKKNI